MTSTCTARFSSTRPSHPTPKVPQAHRAKRDQLTILTTDYTDQGNSITNQNTQKYLEGTKSHKFLSPVEKVSLERFGVNPAMTSVSAKIGKSQAGRQPRYRLVEPTLQSQNIYTEVQDNEKEIHEGEFRNEKDTVQNIHKWENDKVNTASKR